MPGVIRFSDPKANVEGDLLGDLVLDAQNVLLAVTPLTGITDGEWIETKSYDKICLGLICTDAATFKICGSMAVAKPDSSYHGYQLFADNVYIGAYEEILAIKTPIRWLKVRVTANDGEVSAPLIGV